jgi:hypothetical protein
VNLQSLVDELRNNILHDRSDAIAGDPDQLWDDDTLVRYINEAQRRFATRGFVIKDASTQEVVNVTLEDGVATYTLHPSIIAVASARISTIERDLVRTGHSVLNAYTAPSADVWDLSVLEALPPGTPRAFSTDEEIGLDDDDTFSACVLRVYPVPAADDDGTLIKLRVFRKPIDNLDADNMTAIPEIPIDHHIDMLDWAAYLALRIVDTDAGNDKRADKFAASFEAHVTAARKMVLRKLFAPQGWGFGRGGWAWGS